MGDATRPLSLKVYAENKFLLHFVEPCRRFDDLVYLNFVYFANYIFEKNVVK